MSGKAKPSKKKGSTNRKKRNSVLHIEVLQNGTPIASNVLKLLRRGRLAIGNKFGDQLSLPFYPLPNDSLAFGRFQANDVLLDPPAEWEGFCTSKGDPVSIEKGNRARFPLTLAHGDFASFTAGDLRILLRIGAAPESAAPRVMRVAENYRASIFRLIMPTTLEWQITAIAVLMAFVVIGSACLGFLNRPTPRPTSLADVNDEYVLHFISPQNLSTGPEALQKNLRRSQYIRQVMEYYSTLTASMMGWPMPNEKLLLPTTIETDRLIQESSRSIITSKRNRQQEIDQLQLMKNDAGVLAVPSVIGESMNGKMLRVQDKISLGHDSFKANVLAKKAMNEIFRHDPDYAWEEYRNAPKGQSAAEQIAKINPFPEPTEEELVYTLADDLAKRAAKKQRPLLNSLTPADQITAKDSQPVAIPEGARFASFAHQMDLLIADEKLYHLQGMEFGHKDVAPIPKPTPVKEPLIGEIDPAIIEGYIKSNRFDLQLCYELALRRNEQAAGVMEWRWRIDSRGTISDLALISTSIKDSRMTDCIRKKIATWRFPRPRNGSIEVSYPFEFAPTKG